MTKKVMCFWLRAFFDCEGWVFVKQPQNRHMGLDSVNHKGLEQIQKGLNKLGISSVIKSRKNRSTDTLFIFDKQNLIRFQKKIGFLHPDKQRKLQEAIDSYVDYNWKIPNKKSLNYVKKLFKKTLLGGKWKRVRVCSNKRINLIKVNQYLYKYFGIYSIVSRTRFNGIGTPYFELSINRVKEIAKLKKLLKQ